MIRTPNTYPSTVFETTAGDQHVARKFMFDNGLSELLLSDGTTSGYNDAVLHALLVIMIRVKCLQTRVCVKNIPIWLTNKNIHVGPMLPMPS